MNNREKYASLKIRASARSICSHALVAVNIFNPILPTSITRRIIMRSDHSGNCMNRKVPLTVITAVLMHLV